MRFVIPAVILMVVLLGAGAWGYAQAVEAKPKAAIVFGSDQALPKVVSGNDIGFRVVSRQGDKVVSQLVVRIDGEWVAAEFAMGTRPVVVK